MRPLGPCQPIQDQIDSSQKLLDQDVKDLNDPNIPREEKVAIQREIDLINQNLPKLAADLNACTTQLFNTFPFPCGAFVPNTGRVLECIRAVNSNVVLRGAELTQSTQYYNFQNQGTGFGADNSIPLVARKPTIVRVYVDVAWMESFPIPRQMSGTLSYTNLSGLRPPGQVSPWQGPIDSLPGVFIKRGLAKNTLNFQIPASDCVGRVKFTFNPIAIDAPSPVTTAPATLAFNATFNELPTIPFRAVLIQYTNSIPPVPAPSLADWFNQMSYLTRVFPFPGIHFAGSDSIWFGEDLNTNVEQPWKSLLGKLEMMQSTSQPPVIYAGLLGPIPFTGRHIAGIAQPGGWAGVAVQAGEGQDQFSGNLLGHEMGHVFGRNHAPCGGPANVDPMYPPYPNLPSGSIGEFGFDPITQQVLNPSRFMDVMSYCDPQWTSPYNYEGIYNSIIEKWKLMQPPPNWTAPLRMTVLP